VRPEDYVSLMAKYPTLAESIGKGQEAYTSKQKEAEAKFGLQVVNALEGGKTDIAKNIAQERADALRNSGQEQEAAKLEAVIKMIDVNPDIMKMAGNMSIMSGLGAQKYLELTAKTGAGGADLPASIKEAMAYEQLTPEQRQTFESLQKLKNPGSTTSVNISQMDKSSSAEIGKRLVDWTDEANAASDLYNRAKQMRAALPGAITGTAAEKRLDLARFSATLGFTGDKAVVQTQEVIRGLAEFGLQSRELLTGSGAISNFEQEALQKARSGNINLTSGEIKAVIDVTERASQKKYGNRTRLLDSFSKKSEDAKTLLESVSPLGGQPLPVPTGATPSAMPASAGSPPPPLGKPLYKVDY
jgi:hypothetical protein